MTATDILAPVASKTCTKCGECKPTSQFFAFKKSKDGLAYNCKACNAARSAEWRANNTEWLLADKEKRRDRRMSAEGAAALRQAEALDAQGLKECCACAVIKPHGEFYVRSDRKRGGAIDSHCKVCSRLQKAKKWAENSEETKKALSKAHYAKTGDKQKEKKRADYWADPAAASERNRIGREKYRDAILATQKAWYLANQDAQRIKSKAHYEANKQAYMDGNKRRTKLRIESDPVFALSQRIRSLIYIRIYSGGYTKKSRSQEILGCTWEDFKRHIERQFLKGMRWDRLGEIHLDHIVPVATAKTEEDVIALNHFTNIRPMWAKDNLSKGAQITHLI